MTAPNLSEISSALRGAIQLAQLDAGGMSLFNRTAAGFWRSFWAAGMLAPLHVYVLFTARAWDTSDPVRVIAVETIAYAIGWLVYPFVMLLVVDLLGRRERYFDYMVAYNWANAPQLTLQAMVLTIALLSPVLGGFLYLLWLVSVLIYQWFIARAALRIGSLPAVALALLDFALGMALSRVTLALLQAPVPV